MPSVQQIVWLLRHPRHYREGLRLALRRGRTTEGAELRRQVEAWCEECCVDQATTLRDLTGQGEAAPFTARFKTELEAARQRVAQCPVKMGGAGDLELIYRLADHIAARRVIETGVAYGWSSLAFLLTMAQHGGGRLVSTDFPYFQQGSEKYVGVALPEELKKSWTLIPLADREALPQALKLLPEIDMCHYDSDKTAEARLWAYQLLWNALRPGGIFLSDDINDNFGYRDFCAAIGREPLVVKTPATLLSGAKYAGILRK